MNPTEFREVFDLMLRDASAIIRNQQALAGIHQQLDQNRLSPFEQDVIYEDHFGQMPSEPREITVNGVRIITRVLHQTGVRLGDIQGADLLYEIEREKFGIVQYKRSSNGTAKTDADQLETLLDSCPDVCTQKKKRPIPLDWIPVRLNAYCGIWYCVYGNGDRKYVHACEAEGVFGTRKSANVVQFRSGLTKETFLELFALCHIGALTTARDIQTQNRFVAVLREAKHIILEVRQRGKW